MYLVINMLGLLVFLAIGWVFSNNRKAIHWQSVGIMAVLNLVIAWLLTSFEWGRAIVQGAADGFAALVNVAWKGVNFALANWVGAEGIDPEPVNFITSALMPILLVVPMFDILTYIGFLPWVIKWIGRGLSFVTRQPKFETFFSVEMMFLGNTEALAVSKLQIQRMKPARSLTLAMMSMSCVTASIIAAYTQMVPGQFVLTAVPLNCINALIVASMLNPVEVLPEEDVVVTMADVAAETAEETELPGTEQSVEAAVLESEAKPLEANVVSSEPEPSEPASGIRGWFSRTFKRDPNAPKKEPFFSFLGDSILGAGKLILIITANVIAFVALAALIDKLLGLAWEPLSLEHILGVIMYIPALLLGLDPGTAWEMSQLMGLKLVTNEFVAMGEVTETIASFAPHYQATLTVFLTSFANFGTLGMIIGCFKGLADKETNDLISKNVGRMLLSGILVSLLSAGMVGLFIW